MIMCVLLCYPVSIRIYYQQGGLFLVYLLNLQFCVKPETTTEILNEYILYNREIIIGKKIIALYQLPNKYSYDIKIVDILDSEGNILKRSQLNQKLETHLSEMFYNSVVSSIPQVWKKKLRPVQIPKEEHGTDEINIKVDSKLTPLSKTNSKLIYESLLKKIIKPPTSINTWIEIYPFLENLIGLIHLF